MEEDNWKAIPDGGLSKRAEVTGANAPCKLKRRNGATSPEKELSDEKAKRGDLKAEFLP
jgi:hypothetical protein